MIIINLFVQFAALMIFGTIVAVVSYLLSGINPAIILSNLIYHKDIRKEGSGNPGFTNFKRAFGAKYAWWVFVLDLLKGAITSLFAGLLFKYNVPQLGGWALGVAIACVFGMLGHAFPCWYHFKGGKGFLFCLSSLFFISPWAGLVAFVVMFILLITTKYMSLATCSGLLLGAITLFIPLPVFPVGIFPAVLTTACVLFVIIRHHENFKRLFSGTEKKTYIFSKY